MNRRSLFAVPALGMATLWPLAGHASPPPVTPIAAAFMEWHKALSIADAQAGSLPEAEADALINRAWALADRIAEMPPSNAADILMKIAAFSGFGEFDLSEDERATRIWDEARISLGIGVA